MTATNEQARSIYDWEFGKHKQDCLAKMQDAISDYMKLCEPGELRIICGEYEAVIKRSEQC
jgi:hypothetical protein